MLKIKLEELQKYLRAVHNKPVRIESLGELKEIELKEELKGFGYGEPILIGYEVEGEKKKAVLETMNPEGFGHEHFADRAQTFIWAHSAFNKLPQHVRSIDVGAFTEDSSLISVGKATEFFILTEYVEGEEYFQDLERIRDAGKLTPLDLERSKALSDYLVQIHKVKKDSPNLYVRRIRELIGHGECIMGLVDSYPRDWQFLSREELKKIELKCLRWRWKIIDKTHRLRQVHGDFHPWNVKFRKNCQFTVLDRSRGEFGEPADDLSCMSINYIFFSLQKYGKLSGPFKEIFQCFMRNYLNKTKDQEILSVIQPFYAFRSLVIASPIWYPHLPDETRRKIFQFIHNVLSVNRFEPDEVNEYLK